MITGLIFSIHLIFIIYIFVKKIKKESTSAGFISVAFIIIIFAVGWSLASFVANNLIPQSFYDFTIKQLRPAIEIIANGSSAIFNKPLINPNESWKEINGDSFGLILLTIGEIFFYKIYFKDLLATNEGGKEK